jgi:hypothetical protein
MMRELCRSNRALAKCLHLRGFREFGRATPCSDRSVSLLQERGAGAKSVKEKRSTDVICRQSPLALSQAHHEILEIRGQRRLELQPSSVHRMANAKPVRVERLARKRD